MTSTPTPLRSLALSLSIALAPGACAAPSVAAPDADTREAVAPLLGAADGVDAADHDCRVVLREVSREPGPTGGPATSCVDGGPCWYVWSGTFDVSDALLATGGAPALLHRSSWEPGSWWETPATATEGAAPGWTRFRFRLTAHTAPDGASLTSLQRTRLELVPFVRTQAGGRLFDHNAHPGDFDNHVLASGSAWSLARDPAVCPAPAVAAPEATLVFRRDWGREQHGAIVRGGRLTLDYDLARLPQCQGSRYSGLPAWETLAYVRFLPGGQLGSGPLRGAEDPATGAFASRPFSLDVPRDAERVELWFFTSGRSCSSAHDSDYGRNYGYEVLAASPAPVGWAGRWGGSFARDCAHRDGLPEPIVLDSYVRERACSFVDADVYVPGVTDTGDGHPERVLAVVDWTVDDGAPRRAWLAPVGRFGNDVRFRWELPRAELTNLPWSRYAFSFRFSTDGTSWHRIAQADGPDGGAARTVLRDPSW